MASKDTKVVSGASSIFHALLKRALKSRMKNDRSALMAYVDCIAVLKQDECFCAALTPVELSFDVGKLSRNFKFAPALLRNCPSEHSYPFPQTIQDTRIVCGVPSRVN